MEAHTLARYCPLQSLRPHGLKRFMPYEGNNPPITQSRNFSLVDVGLGPESLHTHTTPPPSQRNVFVMGPTIQGTGRTKHAGLGDAHADPCYVQP